MRSAIALALLASSIAAGAEARVTVPAGAGRRRAGGGMIPDRVSIEPGEHYFPLYRHLGVLLDGRESDSVVEFCRSEGWVRLCLRNPDGRMKRERGRIVATLRTGVEIEPFWRGGVYPGSAVEESTVLGPQACGKTESGLLPPVKREVARRLRQAAAREAKLAQRAAR